MSPPLSARKTSSSRGQSANAASAGAAFAHPKSIWVKLAYGFGGALLLIILLILAIAAWAWTQRYSLIERQAVVYLKSIGIEGDLSIRSMNGTQADIRNVSLAYDGEPFLGLDQLEAEYQWRDLLQGRVEALTFTGLNARIQVDETGQLIDGWMPPSTGQDGNPVPPRGIKIKRGSVTIDSPYGNVPIAFDATVNSPRDFAASGALENASLNRGDLAVTLSGPFEIFGPDWRAAKSAADQYRLSLPRTALSLTHPSGQVSGARFALDAAVDPKTRQVIGEAALSNGDVQAAGLSAQIKQVSLQGQYAGADEQQFEARFDVQDVKVIDPARRRALAEQFTLSAALKDMPVAGNFAPQLTEAFEQLLGGSRVQGQTAFESDADKRTLRLLSPLRIEGGKASAVLAPDADHPFYRYPQQDQDDLAMYQIRTAIQLSAPIPLKIAPLALTVQSPDGLRVEAITAVSGTVATEKTWRARTPQGRPAALRPVRLAFDYKAPGDGPPQFTARGAADYDGDIPGGYITGLTAAGRVKGRVLNSGPEFDFTPSGDLFFAKLETSSDWDITDFTGDLAPAKPLYKRRADSRASLSASLTSAQFKAVRGAAATGGAAQMQIEAKDTNLSAMIRKDRQDWTIDFAQAGMTSEAFPVQNIKADLSNGTLEATLSPGARTQLKLRAPRADIDTPAYSVADMAVDLNGTAEAYVLDYDARQVRMKAGAVPPLPAKGSVQFEAGRFTGQATTRLPKTVDQPVSVDYVLQDGAGQANVTIRDLQFKPRGLQPQDLAPALRGKIASAEGSLNSDLIINFRADSPPSGSGVIDIVDMAVGTAPGPVTGLSGRIELTSLFPVVTLPSQKLTVDRFDPGIPLLRGEFIYTLVEDGINIEQASWPMGAGRIALDPVLWRYRADRNQVTLRVEDVEISEFLGEFGKDKISATGLVSGAIPVIVEAIDVRVEKGRIEVKNGGVIQYVPPPGEDLGPRLGHPEAARAFKALENFRYDSLFAEIDGPLDGDLRLGLSFTGSNDEVLYGVPFAFDVSVEGELFNIARSLNPNALSSQVITQIKAEKEAEANAPAP